MGVWVMSGKISLFSLLRRHGLWTASSSGAVLAQEQFPTGLKPYGSWWKKVWPNLFCHPLF
jgi:hypothetical protein